MSNERKDEESVIHRQAQCSCKFCGEKHESTIAPPNRGFGGREETIGQGTDNAVGDALNHMKEMMGDNFRDYQKHYHRLRSGKSVEFSDSNSEAHTIQVVTLNQ